MMWGRHSDVMKMAQKCLILMKYLSERFSLLCFGPERIYPVLFRQHVWRSDCIWRSGRVENCSVDSLKLKSVKRVQNQIVFPLSCWNLLRLQMFPAVLSCDRLVLALKSSRRAKLLSAVLFSSLSTSLTDQITRDSGTWYGWNQQRQFWQYCAECFVGLLGGFPKLPRQCTCSWNNSLISKILTISKEYCIQFTDDKAPFSSWCELSCC